MLSQNDSTGMVMPVAPAYASNGGGFGNAFGGDWAWIILLLLLCGNGFGGYGGLGGYGGDLYPWMNNSQNINGGFRDQMINGQLTGIQSSITSGFGDVQTSLCGGFAGVNANIANGFAQAEIAENSRQMANMNQMFNIQSSLQNCCCENRANIADLKYTVASENCADRQALSDATRDIIASNNAGIQRILDKICDSELQAERRENANLRSELMYARGQASQVAQTAELRQNGATQLNQLISELRSCPIPAQPVYGSQPIFTCGGNNGCGCGCNQF